MRNFIIVGALGSLIGCSAGVQREDSQIVAGAGFTTFDALQGGCTDGQHPNGINCNNYSSKEAVYLTGGPTSGGLSDGSYFFAVLVPGHQNGGFLDGQIGNLSDIMAGGTVGDVGSGDPVTNRTFTVADHQLFAYDGTHAIGIDPQGEKVIQLMPYDDTSNAGGVYVLAICAVTATDARSCKYDAFRIHPSGSPPPPFPVVTGAKYYDANANGQRDQGEVGIAGWPINFTDEVGDTMVTDTSGNFQVTLIADSYRFWESQATNTTTLTNGVTVKAWVQTGNTLSQISTSGGATATLGSDMSYALTLIDGSEVDGVLFGNLCLGAGNGLTLGFWSNRNGQALMNTNIAGALALLDVLHLRDARGATFDPTSYKALRSWLLNGTATNMAYMLSVQLATMELNVFFGKVNGAALVYAPGSTSANAAGFASVSALMAEADAALAVDGLCLAGDPNRAYEAALEVALDSANNNLTFVQAMPATCPAPSF